MKKVLQFFVLAILTTSWMAVTAQEYLIQEGFASDAALTGWSWKNTYNSSGDEHGLLPGNKAVKMKSDTSVLQLPGLTGVGDLSYWMDANESNIAGSLNVQTAADSAGPWTTVQTTTIADAPDAGYFEKTLTIDSDDEIFIRFFVVGDVGEQTVFWIDDVQVTNSAIEFHFKEGFETGDAPEGWTMTNTFLSSNADNNNGELTGDYAVKMKGDFSEIQLPAVSGAGVLSFWLYPQKAVVGGVFTALMSNDGGTTWDDIFTYTTLGTTDTIYVKHSVDINDASAAVQIKLLAEGGASGDGVMYLDDVQLTKLTVADDDANLATLTIDGESVNGFIATTFAYETTLNFGAVEIPVIAATANHNDAVVTITQMTDIYGDEAARTATVEVVSKDKTVTNNYTVTADVSTYHAQIGFNFTGGGLLDDHMPEWTSDPNYWVSSSVKGPGNHGEFMGDAAYKFVYKHHVDTVPWIQTPDYEMFKSISFWLFIEEPRTGEPSSVTVEKIVGDVVTELGVIQESEYTTDAWTQFTFEVNSIESASVRLTTDQPFDDADAAETEDQTRIWLDDIALLADKTISINEVNRIGSDLNCYPNPVHNILNISVTNETIKQVSLVNIIGSVVYSSVNQTSTIDVSGLNDGVYLLQVETASGVLIQKVLKK